MTDEYGDCGDDKPYCSVTGTATGAGSSGAKSKKPIEIPIRPF